MVEMVKNLDGTREGEINSRTRMNTRPVEMDRNPVSTNQKDQATVPCPEKQSHQNGERPQPSSSRSYITHNTIETHNLNIKYSIELAYTYNFPCTYPTLGANASHLHITMSMNDCPAKVS
jgi:hypothetical protein